LKKWGILALKLMLASSLSVVQAQELSGEDLVKRLNCLGCHSLAGKGGDRGPSWDGVGNRMRPEAIKKQIVSPQGKMPNFAHLKPEELNTLVQYVSGLK
jgi:ubiquinol-cytochrome c reductase cytochrome b subunit